jgi:hypothetical protein
MKRKARPASGKVNAALRSPVYSFGSRLSLVRLLRTFSLAEEYQVNENA